MHIDINSCFATIEQQANPILRGKPIVVAAFTTQNGCILAASIEAKKLGIKTGMRVGEGKGIYKDLVVLPPDPWKYRNVHKMLKRLLYSYSSEVFPKSIDEFVLKPAGEDLLSTAKEIKERIRSEIGEWISVSIGISTNRYLAKIAASYQKPDGLIEINKDNFLDIYSTLKLTDLTGIKYANQLRLNSVGIFSVCDLYDSPIWKIKAAFHSITGLYWYTRLHGYEVDEIEFTRKSYGNSVALGKNFSSVSELSPILSRLSEKTGMRLRKAGYKARGIHLSLLGKNGIFWHKGRILSNYLFDSRDIFKEGYKLLVSAQPKTPIANIAISCFALIKNTSSQMDLFKDTVKSEELTKAIDKVNERWGDFVISMARSAGAKELVLDRIAFGGVSDL
jgi:DNA polymerase-4